MIACFLKAVSVVTNEGVDVWGSPSGGLPFGKGGWSSRLARTQQVPTTTHTPTALEEPEDIVVIMQKRTRPNSEKGARHNQCPTSTLR